MRIAVMGHVGAIGTAVAVDDVVAVPETPADAWRVAKVAGGTARASIDLSMHWAVGLIAPLHEREQALPLCPCSNVNKMKSG
jgi:hypothetical protein